MLLHLVRGCRSYEDIRTVNGVVHESFQKACYALRLLADDEEWSDCLKEVAFWGSGYKVRNLFVTILMHCQVSDVQSLWEKNWELLSDDILFNRRRELNLPNLQLSTDEIKDMCLVEIDKLLQKQWKSLADFPGLPIPSGTLRSNSGNRMIAEELNYNSEDLMKEFNTLYPKLNSEQMKAFDEIITAVEEGNGNCFFVDGFGGTGKTFLWKVICLKLRAEKKIVLCVASSGIAALLMVGGRTAHSRFHIPIDCDSKSTCHIEQGTDLAELLQNASLIIWDEAPMAHKYNIEAVDRTLRDILHVKNSNSKDMNFGGISVVFGGDFRQTLPVIAKGTRADIVNSSIKRSYLWPSLKVLKLSQNMRLCTENCGPEEAIQIEEFSRWILQIGDGVGSNVFGETMISIPTSLSSQCEGDPIADIVNEVYGDLHLNHSEATYLVHRAILAPHHEMVSTINNYMMERYPGDEVCYHSSDSIEVDPGNKHHIEGDYSVEFLNTLKISNFPDHSIRLKVGCPVILLRNMDQSTGLCNGTRMIVKRLGTWFIEVEILTGTHIGDRIFLPRIKLSTHYKSLDFTLVRRQYPIAVCFAMTINKSQGQTLKHVGLCLKKQVFSHGQLYVALSRVTTHHGMKILSCDSEGEESKTMQNIVFEEIFH
ncbi:unnamed protein product [Linum trigynum]